MALVKPFPEKQPPGTQPLHTGANVGVGMGRSSKLPIIINRRAPAIPLYPFTDYFMGFDRVQAVRDVFGERTEEVLGKLRVGFTSGKYMYMGVSDVDGNLRVGTHHLKNGDFRTLYLDVIHELFHVKQFKKDREYFRREHRKYLKNGFNPSLYFRSPIEVPAYKHAVDEARRIGMSHDEIAEYLKMGPVDPRVFSRLLKDVGLGGELAPAPSAKLPVRINRSAWVPLYPFSGYFKGFEQAAAVRALFGPQTRRVLNRLKVEFSGTPIMMIFPDEEDGHLQVSVPYLKTGDVRLLYTDVLMCLNVLKQISARRRVHESRDRQSVDDRVLTDSYSAAMKEARRIGLSDIELTDHLQALRFSMTPEGFQRFLKRVGLAETGH